jgi:hypothetical protein
MRVSLTAGIRGIPRSGAPVAHLSILTSAVVVWALWMLLVDMVIPVKGYLSCSRRDVVRKPVPSTLKMMTLFLRSPRTHLNYKPRIDVPTVAVPSVVTVDKNVVVLPQNTLSETESVGNNSVDDEANIDPGLPPSYAYLAASEALWAVQKMWSYLRKQFDKFGNRVPQDKPVLVPPPRKPRMPAFLEEDDSSLTEEYWLVLKRTRSILKKHVVTSIQRSILLATYMTTTLITMHHTNRIIPAMTEQQVKESYKEAKYNGKGLITKCSTMVSSKYLLMFVAADGVVNDRCIRLKL